MKTSSLFDTFVAHARHYPEIVPDMRVDAHARHASTRLASHWVRNGHVVAHAFDSGMLVSSMAGHLRQAYGAADDMPYAPALGLSIMLSGYVQWRDAGGKTHDLSTGRLWCQRGHAGKLSSEMRPGPISHLHVAVPGALLQRWLADADDAATRGHIAHCLRAKKTAPSVHVHGLTAELAVISAHLQTLLTRRFQQAPTLAERLQFEGSALALLGQWLQMPPQPAVAQRSRSLRAVDAAIDIIHTEFAADLSIGLLARRVGTNECYLKRGFRERTGMGIAAFVRQQRMNKALELLEANTLTVRQVAHHVGYQSLGHFARAFRSAHGYRPSDVCGEAATWIAPSGD